MNVTEEQLKKYLETFHKSLEETAKQFLPKEQFSNLLHLSLLPAKITGYVSTLYGIAIEYQMSEKTIYEIIKGSARVEDLFFNAPKKIRETSPIISASGANLTLKDLILSGKFPLRLSSIKASVRISKTRCVAEGWERIIEYAEFYGDRKSEHWDETKAISRAKDEVLVALAELKKAKSLAVSLDEYIKIYKETTVLLLGDYSQEGKIRLDAIRFSLKKLKYNVLIVGEFPDHPQMSLPQKVTAFASISRFIVIDDSVASGHLRELSNIEYNKWVTIILHADGQRSSYMTADASIYSSVIFETDYSPDQPDDDISKVVSRAENKISIPGSLNLYLKNVYRRIINHMYLLLKPSRCPDSFEDVHPALFL